MNDSLAFITRQNFPAVKSLVFCLVILCGTNKASVEQWNINLLILLTFYCNSCAVHIRAYL